jgi:hypothetical protein
MQKLNNVYLASSVRSARRVRSRSADVHVDERLAGAGHGPARGHVHRRHVVRPARVKLAWPILRVVGRRHLVA